ncbi:MAG: formylmethanofuran dehydrogenase subunit [Archaeoglobi archaeon]|nr:tRNA CCA-pyrophosphorylase [Candidatus Mnemosynella bozhongmuii]MDK2781247.1 formylmethanofuran dehydrogenase subunit [Archaeoglobi archaeon]
MRRKVFLITGRTIEQGVSLESKTLESYFESTCVCEMNQELMKELGVREGDSVKVRSEFGEAVVRVKRNDGNPPDVIFIPMGLWANLVIDPRTCGTGMPGYKAIEVTVERTEERPKSMMEILAEYGGGEPI